MNTLTRHSYRWQSMRRSVPRTPIRSRVATSIGQMLFSSGIGERMATDEFLIVAFHRVNAETAGDALTCHPKMFDDLCQLFAEHFDVMSLDTLVENLGKARRSEKQPLAITFDDGYLDNCRIAAPILARYGLPATFFVTTDFVSSHTVAPWDRKLTHLPPWMHWDDVEHLKASGFDIGCHTRTHPDLGKLAGAAAQDEIYGARSILANRLGQAPMHFAFPFGRSRNISESNRALIKAAGFRSLSACEGGTNTVDADLFRLARVPIASMHDTAQHFALLAKLGRL